MTITAMPKGRLLEQLLPNELVVGGRFLATATGGEVEHVNPATGRSQRVIPMAGAAEVDEAVAAARAALTGWRMLPPSERRRLLSRFADLIRANLDDLSATAALEIGSPVTQMPFLVQWAADWIEDAAGWADKLYGSTSPLSDRGVFEYTAIEPCGVVAVVATWNGSIGGFGMSAAAPLAAGCTIVVKCSEMAPFGILRAASLALEAGIPPGVVNVITGGPEASQGLVSHPGIDKVTFTGSPETARHVAAACAQRLTPCVFELGGKSAVLVFDDASLDRAVADAMQVTGRAGQICTLGSRLVVQVGVYDEFVGRLAEAARAVKQGMPFDAGVSMGPVINRAAFDRILALIERARGYGDVVTGGAPAGGELADGFFLQPTVIATPDNTGEIARSEVFGPVLTVIPFHDEDDAVSIANDSDYGLAAYLHTADVSRVHRVAAQLDVGSVGVNAGAVPAGAHLPFGGRKQSGYGKQGGLAGVAEFVNTKTVQLRL